MAIPEQVQTMARAMARWPETLPILLLGETGTGKTRLAKQIHAWSGRAGSFEVANCAAIPDNLQESELFGHDKGSFTGATGAKRGLFELAHGGTLFLDEIGDASPEMQAALLHVLEGGKFRRVGGREVEVDVLVVAATHSPDNLRPDLLARLTPFGKALEMPSLRDRDDIQEIVDELVLDLSERCGRELQVADEARAWIARQDWPGNVRGLFAALRGCALFNDVLDPRTTTPKVKEPEPTASVAGRWLKNNEVCQLLNVSRPVLDRLCSDTPEADRVWIDFGEDGKRATPRWDPDRINDWARRQPWRHTARGAAGGR